MDEIVITQPPAGGFMIAPTATSQADTLGNRVRDRSGDYVGLGGCGGGGLGVEGVEVQVGEDTVDDGVWLRVGGGDGDAEYVFGGVGGF